jgi:hypothetical protein
MGGAVIETGVIICDGDDVLNDLNDVFGDPSSDKFKHAKKQAEAFGNIANTAGNYNDLIRVYKAAGLTVSSGWAAYLRMLGTVSAEGPDQGPTNIWNIAQFRSDGLTNDLPMSTVVHVPKHGGHVHTRRGSGGNPSTVDSPCPLPPAK